MTCDIIRLIEALVPTTIYKAPYEESSDEAPDAKISEIGWNMDFLVLQSGLIRETAIEPARTSARTEDLRDPRAICGWINRAFFRHFPRNQA